MTEQMRDGKVASVLTAAHPVELANRLIAIHEAATTFSDPWSEVARVVWDALAAAVAERDAELAQAVRSLEACVRDRNYAMRQRDEERRAKEGNIEALNTAITDHDEARAALGAKDAEVANLAVGLKQFMTKVDELASDLAGMTNLAESLRASRDARRNERDAASAEVERLTSLLRCDSARPDEDHVWCHLDKGHDAHHVAEGGYVWPSDIFIALQQRDEARAAVGAVAALADEADEYAREQQRSSRVYTPELRAILAPVSGAVEGAVDEVVEDYMPIPMPDPGEVECKCEPHPNPIIEHASRRPLHEMLDPGTVPVAKHEPDVEYVPEGNPYRIARTPGATDE